MTRGNAIPSPRNQADNNRFQRRARQHSLGGLPAAGPEHSRRWTMADITESAESKQLLDSLKGRMLVLKEHL